ncbi:MAG: ERF family protein [bacterium]|nr:ERF family protein [bacterium]
MQQLDHVIPVPRYTNSQPEQIKQNNNNIAMALIAFHQTNPHAFEDKVNPHFRNKYASLESVIKTVRSSSKFGLTFTQEMDFEGDISFVRTVMMHSSGEMRISRTKIVSKDPNDPQKQGSAISYAKRYGLQSIFGLPSDDDDGEVATITPPVAPKITVGVSTSGGNHSSPPPEVDFNSLIANAKTEKELTDLYVKHKPTDQNIINKFKTKKGELNGR